MALSLGPGGSGEPAARLAARRVEREGSVLVRNATLTCPDLTLGAGTVSCADGRLGIESAEGDIRTAQLVLSGARGRDGGSASLATSSDVPAAWLTPVFRALDPSTATAAGRATLAAGLVIRADATTLAGTLRFEGLSLSGRNVAEDATGRIRFDVTQTPGGAASGAVDARLDAGALYLEPGIEAGGIAPGFLIEADSAGAPVRLGGIFELTGDVLQVDGIEIFHPGTLDCAGGARFTLPPAARAVAARLGGALPAQFRMACDTPDVASLYRTYLQPLLYATPLADLDLTGGTGFDLELARDRLVTGHFRFDDFFLADLEGRFAVSSLNGDIAIEGAPRPRASGITFEGAEIRGIPIGAGAIGFVSSNGEMTTTEVADVPVLDGMFHVDALRIASPGRADATVTIAGRLSPVSLPKLCNVFGWPPFGGVAAMRIPELTYTRRAVTLDGVIDASVFDGRVAVRDLELDDLFGRVPRLTANVQAEALDLAQLTGALAFGNIEGHVDGRLDGLVLEAWKPARFDASIRSTANDPTRHRISRRAVDDIGQLGSGAATPLSSGWLRFIPSYSYGRIGVGCRFRRGFCWLSGLEGVDDRDEFTILSPGGLLPPWIQIRGQGRLIAWETLRAGFRRIGEGGVQVSLSD